MINRLWIVFPALNIGYYGDRVNRKKPDDEDSEYSVLRSRLRQVVKELKKSAIVITFPEQMYGPLFHAYHVQYQSNERYKKQRHLGKTHQEIMTDVASTLDKSDETLVAECTSSAVLFAKNDIDENGGVVHHLEPHQFPAHVMVIGDVIYFLSSYGLPYYRQSDNTFHPVVGESRVSILAYRWKDKSMADMISNHLRHHLESVAAGKDPKE